MKNTIGKNIKVLRECSLDDLIVKEAIEYGINDNIAKKLITKPKIKNKLSKTQSIREFGSRKPKNKNHNHETIREMNTYLVELENEDSFSDIETALNLSETTNKKLTFDDLKNM